VARAAHDGLIRKLAGRGYVAAAIDYRVGARSQFPAPLEDVKAAVRFVRANAERFGIDPARICALGESAGAPLALLTALTPGVADFDSGANQKLQARARKAAADYLGADAAEVALTDSTTMGLGLLYGGLRLEPGQEVLTTSNDYFATHEALRAASDRSGASVREIDLYEHGENVSEQELVHRVTSAVAPQTRAVALTWVHSSTGLKMPLAHIVEALEDINEERDEDDRALLCVDGVHGFGVESARMKDLGADFFAAGCHKWLFGPRGTGILWGRKNAWAADHSKLHRRCGVAVVAGGSGSRRSFHGRTRDPGWVQGFRASMVIAGGIRVPRADRNGSNHQPYACAGAAAQRGPRARASRSPDHTH
jgi:hypothetical protein